MTGESVLFLRWKGGGGSGTEMLGILGRGGISDKIRFGERAIVLSSQIPLTRVGSISHSSWPRSRKSEYCIIFQAQPKQNYIK